MQILNATAETTDLTATHGLSYAEGPRHGVDVYAPHDADAAPVAIFYYGGSWQGGARQDYAFVGRALAARGIVTFVPDYRVHPEIQFPEFLNDAAQVVHWVRDRAASFGGAPDRIVLVGHSAGAHIAAMLTLNENWLTQVGLDPNRDIAGMVGLAGPYDFLPLRDETLKAIFGPPERWTSTQPINFVDGPAPPMLLVTGGLDLAVDPGNTTRLAATIRAKGGAVRVIRYPWMGHALLLGAFARPLRLLAPTLDDTADFILNAPRTIGGRQGLIAAQ